MLRRSPLVRKRRLYRPWHRVESEKVIDRSHEVVTRQNVREVRIPMPTPCTEGISAKGNNGYVGSKHGPWEHRAIYQRAHGRIPTGMVVDHLCHNRACLNLEHLTLTSIGENTRRGFALITHCSKGHEFTPQNTYINSHGHRGCRACHRKSESNRRRAKKGYDLVKPGVRWVVLKRDGKCVMAKLDSLHECRNVFGTPHASTDLRKLTMEHIKDDLMMGQRAPSDMAHMIALCGALNTRPPTKVQRAAFREYLARVNR